MYARILVSRQYEQQTFTSEFPTSQKYCLDNRTVRLVGFLLGTAIMDNWRKHVYKRKEKRELSPDEWIKLRDKCLRKHKYICYRCDRSDVFGLTAHHIIPRCEGGANDISNLVALCAECHDYVEIHGLMSKPEIIGSYEGRFIDPNPVEELDFDREESFVRPEWHKYVYGGRKKRK